MSLQYLLDGYNLVHKMESLSSRKLEDQRSGLIRYIEINAPQGNNPVTIVFDGQIDVYSPHIQSKVKVIYSEGESADDKIKRIVKSSDHAKSIVVVTDDREIQISVKASGAKVLSVKDFLRQKSDNNSKSGPKVSFYDAKEITQELEDIWLNKDNDQTNNEIDS